MLSNSTPASPSHSERPGELRTKLLWITIFRTVAITLLLAAIAVRLLANPLPEALSTTDTLAFIAIGAVYLLTLFYAFWLKRREVGPVAAWGQVGADIVLATGLVYATGGADSPYAFTYLLAVVAASILLYQRGAIIAAVTSSVAFTALVLLIRADVLPLPPGANHLLPGRIAFILVSNVLAQVLIAALATYLARQLWTTGGRLSEREADLRDLADLQNKILASMPSGLLTVDTGGLVTFANRAAESILGLTGRGQQEPIPIDTLLPGIRTFPTGKRGELNVETPGGKRVLGLTATPLSEASGEFLIVFQDLTELRRVEEELKRVDRLAALGKLSAQLAHEIRNPLAAMRGSAQLLAAEGHSDPGSAKLATVLVRESDRLSVLVEDFLRFARPPPPQLRESDLAVLTRETVDMLMTDPLSRGIRVDAELSPVVARIDPDQLRQVLINLLRNAFAAAGPGGEVKVSVAYSAGLITLKVWDSAGGIAPEDLGRVFEPFFTRRAGGTGLGLSTAHSIVHAHGGTIQVTSSPRRGTEFVIALTPMEVARASADS